MISIDPSRRPALARTDPSSGCVVGGSDSGVSEDACLIGGLFVSFGADPRSELVVSWRDDGDLLEVMPDAGDGWYLAPSVSIDNATGVRRCHVRVIGLDPGCTYRLRIADGRSGSRSREFVVATAPEGRTAFRFSAFGDHGVTAEARSAAARVAALRPAFHLHPGDLAYANVDGHEQSRGDPDAWWRWVDLVTGAAPGVPWLAVPGNHDTDGRRVQRLDAPDGCGRVAEPDPAYDGFRGWVPHPRSGPPGVDGAFRFRFASLGVVGLDGNLVSSEYRRTGAVEPDAQTPWLDETLADFRRDPAIDLIVVMVHHCAFATDRMHGSDGGVRSRWSPLFDRHAVDLVLSGHNHGYERTDPVDHTGCVRDGAPVYVTVGCGGQVPTRVDRGRHPYQPDASTLWTDDGPIDERAQWSVVRRAVDAVFVADVEVDRSGSTLACRVTDLDGGLVDHFDIPSRR